MEKETVIIGDNQAPVTQKATDHIDEELRLAIFKTLKLSKYFFRILLEFQNEDLKDIARGGGTPYNDLYGEAPPKRGTFSRLQVYERVGISQVEVYKRVGKSAIKVFKRAFNYNISSRRPLWLNHFIY